MKKIISNKLTGIYNENEKISKSEAISIE